MANVERVYIKNFEPFHLIIFFATTQPSERNKQSLKCQLMATSDFQILIQIREGRHWNSAIFSQSDT